MERITIICAEDRPNRLYRAYVQNGGWGSSTYEGASPDEAIGHLIRELDLAGFTPFVLVEVIRIDA